MSTPVKITGTAKAWTTSKWRGIDEINHMISEGENDQAISGMTYINHDMGGTDEWTEVGIAEITVTFYPRDIVVAKAMQGLVAGANPEHSINLHGAAEWSYNMADAMIAAREAE